MKSFLKIVLISVLAIIVFVVVVVSYLGLKVTKGVEHAIERAQAVGPQSVSMTTDGATITSTLQSSGKIILNDVQLCDKGVDIAGVGYSSTCEANICQTTIDVGDVVLPKDLTIHRLYQGKCYVQVVPDIAKFQTGTYEGKIRIDTVVLKQLNIPENSKITKVATSQFNGNSSTSFNDVINITFDYGTVKPTQDDFSLGGKPIHIQYQ